MRSRVPSDIPDVLSVRVISFETNVRASFRLSCLDNLTLELPGRDVPAHELDTIKFPHTITTPSHLHLQVIRAVSDVQLLPHAARQILQTHGGGTRVRKQWKWSKSYTVSSVIKGTCIERRMIQ